MLANESIAQTAHITNGELSPVFATFDCLSFSLDVFVSVCLRLYEFLNSISLHFVSFPFFTTTSGIKSPEVESYMFHYLLF